MKPIRGDKPARIVIALVILCKKRQCKRAPNTMINKTIDQLLSLSTHEAPGFVESIYQQCDNSEAKPEYHLVFGVDGRFIRHAFLTIQSVINHSQDCCLHFHIITAEKMHPYSDDMRTLLAGTCHVIHTLTLNDSLFGALPVTDVFSHAIYYRLLAPYLLSQHAHILYLDADIICLNPFTELFDFARHENRIACVVGDSPALAASLAAEIGLKNSQYFNSGVLLMETRQWRENQISEQVIALLLARGQEFRYMDQDALNIVLEGRVAFAQTRFNRQLMLAHKPADHLILPEKETVFLHYAGADKPWQQWNTQAATRFYRELYAQSAWSSQPYELPKTDQQAKKMYKLCFRQHAFFKGIKWYLSYYVLRYCRKGS